MTYPQILGVYRTKESPQSEAGTGGGQLPHASCRFVRRISDDSYEIQPLNEKHIPTGFRKVITTGALAEGFQPYPDYYEKHTAPAMKTLRKKLELGEKFLEAKLLSKAEKEFIKAVMLDEVNVCANLGLGTIYAETDQPRMIREVMGRLLTADLSLRQEERHMFNTFGITMRKKGYFDDALSYYNKALEFNPDDEHLLFNLARALYGRAAEGDIDACRKFLYQALAKNPDFQEALDFMNFLMKVAVQKPK